MRQGLDAAGESYAAWLHPPSLTSRSPWFEGSSTLHQQLGRLDPIGLHLGQGAGRPRYGRQGFRSVTHRSGTSSAKFIRHGGRTR